MTAFEPVTSVLRAFEVLRIINERDQATVTEIHRVSGLPKPTILRMIETLIAAGYVVRENDRPAYVARLHCRSAGHDACPDRLSRSREVAPRLGRDP